VLSDPLSSRLCRSASAAALPWDRTCSGIGARACTLAPFHADKGEADHSSAPIACTSHDFDEPEVRAAATPVDEGDRHALGARPG
jgi:hypothetical protein